MLKAMRHRILATAAFAVLTLLSAEVGASQCHNRAYSLMYGDWDNAINHAVIKVPAAKTVTLSSLKQVEKIEFKTLEQYKLIGKRNAELTKVYTPELSGMSTVAKTQILSHITAQYYDNFYAEKERIQRGVLQTEVLSDVEKADNIEKADYVKFTASFATSHTNKKSEMKKQIPAVNGLGCYHEIKTHFDGVDVMLKRDSAGNLFLTYSGEKTFFKATVDVTLYVHKLYFTTQNNEGGDQAEAALMKMTSELFPENSGYTFPEEFGYLGLEKKEFAYQLCDFITKARGLKPGYGAALKNSSPDEYCKDMIKKNIGVCRHRAYLVAYVLKKIGITCVYARSVKHAWVEIKGSSGKWACVELGGGASISQDDRDILKKEVAAKAAEQFKEAAEQAKERRRTSFFLSRFLKAANGAAQTASRKIVQGNLVWFKGEDDEKPQKCLVECWWPETFAAYLRHPNGSLLYVEGEEALAKLKNVPENKLFTHKEGDEGEEKE